MAMHVGILGGTGPAGRGLGARLAAAGIEVTLGSRERARAEAAAAELVAAWPDRGLRVSGHENAGAAAAELVVLATPFEGALATVAPLRRALADKVVVSMVSALVRVAERSRRCPCPGARWRQPSPPPSRRPGWRRRSTTSRPRTWGRWRSGWWPMCWSAPTMPRRRR